MLHANSFETWPSKQTLIVTHANVYTDIVPYICSRIRPPPETHILFQDLFIFRAPDVQRGCFRGLDPLV